MRRDLGGDPTTAEEAALELAAQRRVVVQSLQHWIAAQPSLMTPKRTEDGNPRAEKPKPLTAQPLHSTALALDGHAR